MARAAINSARKAGTTIGGTNQVANQPAAATFRLESPTSLFPEMVYVGGGVPSFGGDVLSFLESLMPVYGHAHPE
jgi:hypothetical protein